MALLKIGAQAHSEAAVQTRWFEPHDLLIGLADWPKLLNVLSTTHQWPASQAACQVRRVIAGCLSMTRRLPAVDEKVRELYAVPAKPKPTRALLCYTGYHRHARRTHVQRLRGSPGARCTEGAPEAWAAPLFELREEVGSSLKLGNLCTTLLPLKLEKFKADFGSP